MSHEIVKCKKCKAIIRQCRCWDKNKPVKYELCRECALTPKDKPNE